MVSCYNTTKTVLESPSIIREDPTLQMIYWAVCYFFDAPIQPAQPRKTAKAQQNDVGN